MPALAVVAALAGGLLFGACSRHGAAGRGPEPYASGAASNGEELAAPMQRSEAMGGDEGEADLVLADMPQSMPVSAPQVAGGAGQPLPRAPLVAAAEPVHVPPKPGQPPEAARADALHTGPLLVYTAAFQLHVYEVEKAHVQLKEATKRLGGFVSEQTDTALILRIPSAHFEEALAVVESTGKVRFRRVQALDVGDQYRDLSLRLRTAEALRDRLEAMLARAAKVDEALQVERELERIVREIEQIKGQLRAMGDRIAFSSISVDFRPEARPDLDDSDAFRLPYPWLEELGLHHLLELTP